MTKIQDGMNQPSAMVNTQPRRILFSGYAPVHFLCFLPVYKLLAEDPGLQFWFSGGFRRKDGDTTHFDITGFYDPYPIDQQRI